MINILRLIFTAIKYPFISVYQWLLIKDEISGEKVKAKKLADNIFKDEKNRQRFLAKLSTASRDEYLGVKKKRNKVRPIVL